AVLSDLKSDSMEYKHLQCEKQNSGIANPYIPHVRISNPHERVPATTKWSLPAPSTAGHK
ncbi:MAG: hypothetical protein IJ615_04395, partial [Bacteroidaceae bacterium]|nr:hypothetical protein [Bacteroidaceae bacterium]